MAVDKLVDSTQLNTDLTAVADAIREKGGTSEQLAFPSGFVDAIEAIETGGGGDTNPTAPDNDVIFIDYDGTIRYSYTAADFLTLTELPPNPTHDGLVAQGWNWTLADAKEQVSDCGMIIIGQMYITQSGDTEIDINLTDETHSGYLGFGINGSATIDWGDNSATETITGSNNNLIKTPHTWPRAGNYTVKITLNSGQLTFTSLGLSGGIGYGIYSGLLSVDGTNPDISQAIRSSVTAIRVGSGNIRLGNDAFSCLYALKYITLPAQVTSLQSWNSNYYKFSSCASLTGLVIPSGMPQLSNYDFDGCSGLRYVSASAGIGNVNYIHWNNYALIAANIKASAAAIASNAFEGCFALRRIRLPSTITSIKAAAFSKCYSLAVLDIPATVATIETNAFKNCANLREVHLKPTTPPTLSSTNAFSGVPSDCVFYVPVGTLAAYQAATNWSTYASQMQEEPQ